LKELHRVLAPRGVLRVVVPDVRKCIMAYAAGDGSFFDRRADLWPGQSPRETPLEHFLHYAGAGVRPDVFWGHKFGYDFETLSLLLTRGGFDEVGPSEYMQSEHASLRVDSASRVAGYRHGDDYFSLFVEATKR
jgi:predicted SAM-dependent methyltransferase